MLDYPTPNVELSRAPVLPEAIRSIVTADALDKVPKSFGSESTREAGRVLAQSKLPFQPRAALCARELCLMANFA